MSIIRCCCNAPSGDGGRGEMKINYRKWKQKLWPRKGFALLCGRSGYYLDRRAHASRRVTAETMQHSVPGTANVLVLNRKLFLAALLLAREFLSQVRSFSCPTGRSNRTPSRRHWTNALPCSYFLPGPQRFSRWKPNACTWSLSVARLQEMHLAKLHFQG